MRPAHAQRGENLPTSEIAADTGRYGLGSAIDVALGVVASVQVIIAGFAIAAGERG